MIGCEIWIPKLDCFVRETNEGWMIRILTSHFNLRPWEIDKLTDFQKSVYLAIFFEDLEFAKNTRGLRF